MINRNIYYLVLILTLVLALLVGGKFTYTMLMLVVIIYLYAFISLYYIKKNLVVSFWLDETCVNKDDYIAIEYKVYNSSIFPIPFMEIIDNLPKRLSKIASKREIYQASPFETVLIKREVICEHRGQYDLSEITVVIGDVFGLIKHSIILTDSAHLKVLPKLYTLKDYNIQTKEFFGKLMSSKKYYDDYSNFKHLREYRLGDSLKTVNWKISAKKNELYVKCFDSSSEIRIHIYLDFQSSKFLEDYDNMEEEKLVECTASLIHHMLVHGYETKLTTYTQERVRISGKNNSSIRAFLDALTIIRPEKNINISDIIINEQDLEYDSSVIIIVTNSIDEHFKDTILELQAKGHSVALAIIGNFKQNKSNTYQLNNLNDLNIKYNLIDINDNISQVLR